MPPEEPALLTSWKEVAAYLGKGVRTVQRWEMRLGMPVRRPDNSRSGIIQVSRQELDRWLESRWSPRAVAKTAETTPSPSNASPSKVVRIDLATARNLRMRHRALVSELQRSLAEFTANCEELGNCIARVHKDEVRAASAPESQRQAV